MDKCLNLLIKLEVIMVAWISKIGKAVAPYVKEVGKAVMVIVIGKFFEDAKKAFDKWMDSKNNPDSADTSAE